MNSVCGKVVAIFFAACFLALQFHNLDHTEIEHNTARIFHIEVTKTSEIDKKIHNQSIYTQVVRSHHEFLQRYVPLYNLWQPQLKWGAQHWGTLDFQKELQGGLAAFCEVYRVKLFTSFNFLQALALTFERISTLHAHHKQIQSDESDNHVS
ncbi:MAG: hypothetical protein ABJK37_24345 [Paraglaciecola sp.]|uniref:hypothetical protein n=1 Tax=Paraglaciecola sp. TaxID=1920173 RepID=UPI00329821CE